MCVVFVAGAKSLPQAVHVTFGGSDLSVGTDICGSENKHVHKKRKSK